NINVKGPIISNEDKWMYDMFYNDTATTEIYTYSHPLSLPDANDITGTIAIYKTMFAPISNAPHHQQ
ncbi:hypothetical protein ACE5SO_18385, partial [Lactiplantibacillus pentosus]